MKRRNPRRADPMAGIGLLMRSSKQQFDRAQITDLCLMHSAALTALMQGTADESDIGVLGMAHNVAYALCEGGFAPDEIATVKAAGSALVDLERRHAERGRYVATGSELGAIRAMVDLHRAQIESDDCTTGRVLQAIEEVKNRVIRGEVTTA